MNDIPTAYAKYPPDCDVDIPSAAAANTAITACNEANPRVFFSIGPSTYLRSRFNRVPVQSFE